MANDIVVAQTEQEKTDLEVIRARFGIQEDRFENAVMFANLIVEGISRKKAYEQAYNVDKEESTSRASSTFRAKYVQELIRYFRPDDDTLYIGEVKTIIQRGMEIVRDRRSSPREVTEAMKALQPYIKQQTQMQLDVEVNHTVKPADAVMAKMQRQIEYLSNNGKMVDQSGEIIDVEEVI
jgi:hypothetical protein